MSTFRDDLGVALERIAQLEDENSMLRAELLLAREQSRDACARPRKPRVSWNLEATCWTVLVVSVIAGAVACMGLPESATGGLELDCTTAFVYDLEGQPHAACLSVPP